MAILTSGRGKPTIPDPLTDKGKSHSAAALKNQFEKEQISEVAITPGDKEQEEKTLTLRFKDSNKFLDAVYEFEELKNIGSVIIRFIRVLFRLNMERYLM
jgi:hypothetical protein